MPKHKGKSEVNVGDAIVIISKAIIMAYVVMAIFILFSSIIFTYTNVNATWEGIIVTIGIIVSSFLAGFDTAKVDDRDGYKWGAIGGVIYLMVFFILGTVINKLQGVEPGAVFTIACMILITSTIAGMISVNVESKHSKRY